MRNHTVCLVLLVIAVILFVVQAFGWANPEHVDLTALGLAFGFAAFLADFSHHRV